jgi:translation elongation factor EF-Tu-like GTPase
MGFWSRLMGRAEYDTTVSDYQAGAGRPVDAASEHPAADAAIADAAIADAAFRLTVEDVFTITGRGTVATGRIESGRVAVGDVLEVTPFGRYSPISATVTGIEAFRQRLDSAGEGELVGILLSGVGKADLTRGSVLTRS